MIQFLEEQAGKNLHLEHIEDEIINYSSAASDVYKRQYQVEEAQ